MKRLVFVVLLLLVAVPVLAEVGPLPTLTPEVVVDNTAIRMDWLWGLLFLWLWRV